MSANHALHVVPLVCLLYFGLSFAEEQKPEPNVFELGEVVVTADREAVSQATTVTEVSAAEIRASGARTVAEALDRLPGADVQVGGKREFQIKVRGFAQSDLKVLIDGVPAHETYYRTLDLSMLPVDAISKITVTKGASSVLYGSNTMGGVVNIITKKGSETPVTRIDTSFGDFDTRHVALSHGAAVGKFNYWLTYGFAESDGFRLSSDFNPDSPLVGKNSQYHEDGGQRRLSDYQNHSLNTKVGYEPDEDTEVYLSFDYHNNERGIPPENRYWAFTRWDQWHVNLVGERQFTDIFKLKARGFYVDHEDCVEDVSEGAYQTPTSQRWFEKSLYDDYSVGGELQTHLELGERNLLKMGISFIRDYNEQDTFLDSLTRPVLQQGASVGWQATQTYEADTWSFGVEDEFQVLENLTLVAGLSYDLYDPREAYNQPVPGSADAVNPQGGLVYRPTDTTTLHASVGRKTRFPHLKELYSQVSGGNPDLDPQETIAYEVGVEQRLSESLTGSVTGFYNDIDDLIQQVTLAGSKVYVNVGKAVTQGIETSLSWAATDALTCSTNYTYLDTLDRDNDRPLEYRPAHRLNGSVDYKFPFGLDFRLQTSYTDRQFQYPSATTKRRIPEFLLLDAKLTYKVGRKDIKGNFGISPEFFVQVTNFTDKDYEEGHPMPGREFLAGFALEF